MHSWIRSNYPQYSDSYISHKMEDLNEKKDFEGEFKGWLSNAKDGKMAQTDGYRIWLLAKTLAMLELEFKKDENDEFELRRLKKSFLPPGFRDIIMSLTAKIHAVVSEEFITKAISKDEIFREQTKTGETKKWYKKRVEKYGKEKAEKLTKNFIIKSAREAYKKHFNMVGYDFFSYLDFGKNNLYISPRRGLKKLTVKDIAIDILEILLSSEETTPLEYKSPLQLLRIEDSILLRIERDIQDYIYNLSFPNITAIAENEIRMRNKLNHIVQIHGGTGLDGTSEKAMSIIRTFFFESFIYSSQADLKL